MDQHTHDDQPGESDREVDGNQDKSGRDIDKPENRIGDKSTVKPTDPELAHEASRKIGLQRERKRDDADPSQQVSGGFNQKH